jgi:hypothetical protein
MSFEDEAMKAAVRPVPGASADAARKSLLDGLSVAELATHWRRLQQVGLRDMIGDPWEDTLYFDALPHADAGRAFAMVLEVLEQEANASDRSVLLQLGERFTRSLVHRHGGALIDRIEGEARTNDRLRWLLGGSHWWTPDDALRKRLGAIADKTGWQADRDAHDQSEPDIDFERLTTAELARVWSDLHGRADKDRTDLWHSYMSFEQDLTYRAPNRVIDLILEILAFEESQALLGYLAAGLLENVIDHRTIDRIEREAAGNDRFRWLLGGVWYWNDPEEIRQRLDAIIQGRHWPN